MTAAEEPMDEVDVDLLNQLSELFDVLDPAPDDLPDEIVFRISLAALDAELATFQDTSALALRAAGAASTDTVTFTSSAIQLMVSATDDVDDLLRIDGWVTGGGVEVDLLQGTSSVTATSDAHGRLVWRGVQRGPVRFLIHPPAPEARPVLTPVIEL